MAKTFVDARRFGLADGVVTLIADAKDAARRYVSYRRTLAQLEKLDADALLDLDLYRGDLRKVAWNAAFHG